MRRRHRKLHGWAALWTALLIVTSGLAWAAERAAPTTIRVAPQPLTNFTPLLIAKEKGWFSEENLNVSWTMITQAAVAVEAVYGGSAEFGGGGILEPIIARGNGLDITFAVAGSRVRSRPPDNFGLFVREADPIRGPADLVGKRVSVGLINSVSYIHTVEWLRKNNVDPKGIQFLELPLPQMPDALLQNRIDAGWIVEPFLTVLAQTGKARALSHPYHETVPGMDITHYFAKESWLRANADAARRFKRAVDRATMHLNAAPKDERNAWVAKFSGVKPDLVERMTLPFFITEFNVESLQANLDLATRQGLVKPFDVKTMIWRP